MELKDVTKLKYYEISSNNPIEAKLGISKGKRLYHYTDKDAAQGILESNALWVTHSSFLDDITEIRYISLVLEGVIRYLYENKELYDTGVKGQFYVYEAIIKTLEALKKTYKHGAPITGGNIFILSLTEDGDNEFLYKNYSKANGAVLEFKNDVNSMFIDNKYLYAIQPTKVEYDLGNQMTLLLEDINEFYAEVLNNLIREKTVNYMELVEMIKSVIYIKVINYSFFFKHFNFAKEKECRVIFLVDEAFGEVRYRKRTDRHIPYIVVDLGKNILLGSRFIQG